MSKIEKTESPSVSYLDCLFKSITNPVFIIDVRTKKFLDANNAACDLYMYTREEILNMRTSSISAEPDKTDEAIDNLITDVPLRFHRKKDGTIFPVKIIGGYSEMNGVCYNTVIVYDISNLITTLSSLKESEENLKKIFETIPDGIVISRIDDGLILDMNSRYGQISGYTQEEVIGRTSVEVNMYKHPGIRKSMIEALCKDGYLRDREVEIITKNGEAKFISISVEPFSYRKENCIISIIKDLSYKKKIENELFESQQLYKATIEQSQDGINIKDLNGNYIIVNPAFCNMTGYTNSELLSMSVKDLVPQGEEEKLFQGENNTIMPGFKEVNLSRKDGSVFIAQITDTLLELGNKKYVQGMIRDVTRQKQIEKELIAAKEKAEESDRLKTAFLQNMSHEIRTPMNAIMGFSDLLTRKNFDKEHRNRYLNIINQRTSDLLEIINDILNIAKIESGQLQASIDNFLLDDFLKDLETFSEGYKSKLNKHSICFILYQPNELEKLTIKTDQVKLRQIFTNLISNAFKFTFQGEISAGIRKSETGQLIFFVSDTGIGISKNQMDLIFERFYQIKNNTTQGINGTGLGLPITKALVKLLGGEIWVTSEPEKGSCFSFTIDCKVS